VGLRSGRATAWSARAKRQVASDTAASGDPNSSTMDPKPTVKTNTRLLSQYSKTSMTLAIDALGFMTYVRSAPTLTSGCVRWIAADRDPSANPSAAGTR